MDKLSKKIVPDQVEICDTLTLLEEFFIGSNEETVAKVVSVLGNIQVLQGKLTLQLQYIVLSLACVLKT